MGLLPIPTDWAMAREALAPLADRALAGNPPSEQDLLEAALEAYGLTRRDVAPLVAWLSL